MAGQGLWRSRWAAIGAAVAVTLGAGGLYSVGAATDPSSFVAITPVRVLDTRIGAGLDGDFTSGRPRLLDVTGTIEIVGADGVTVASGSPVPDGATAIVANVTAVFPSTAGFIAMRPGTASGTPTTSNVNFTSAGVVSPNSVTVALPTTGSQAGKVQLFFQGTVASATTDILVDIVGYYRTPPSTSGGMTYVGEFTSLATTGIGDSPTPLAPTGYTATFDTDAPGRYHVAGNLTVFNQGAATNTVACLLYVNDTVSGPQSLETIPASGYGSLSLDTTFVLAAAGATQISYRCFRLGVGSMYYYLAAMTLFRVG